ncbi:MAG: elongation factor 1-beta [Thermoplasmata archaeon]|nr:MAG: elongation factor 1-beta [Thermoplasmata archaeon]
MGEVVALIRVMPKDILDEAGMEKLKSRIEERIKEPARLERMEVKDIAFGIKAINVTVVVPDAAGGADLVAESLSKIDEVESAEVVDVGRL